VGLALEEFFERESDVAKGCTVFEHDAVPLVTLE